MPHSHDNLPVGEFIRRKLIPSGMTVKEAAKRLGIGRPALSNLLNGKAALSPEMAMRLETTFGANRQDLLDRQGGQDQAQRRGAERAVPVSAYVPSFLMIKARQIEDWAAHSLHARDQLPVAVRKLIHSTGRELRQVDFPGYDNAQRRGWDGWTVADAATPWIPDGSSGWEFGTDERPDRKAAHDYAARLKAVPAAERAQTTFIFLTPRNWSGKTQWARDRNAAGQWKAVKAYDACDLEQWLETSVSALVWLAEQLAIPTDGFETLEECWRRWASASNPPVAPEIFAPSIAAYKNVVRDWLRGAVDRPLVVTGDSKEEALAFLSQIFAEPDLGGQPKDLPVVFHSPQVLKKLLASTTPFIPIVASDGAERELGGAQRRHAIVVRPRNAVDSEPDIALDLLSDEAFEKALAAMGIQGDRAEQLARDSAQSPTILRRLLSDIDAIRTPSWARDPDVARTLIPLVLVGAWHAESTTDCEALCGLARRSYPEIEDDIARLLKFDDSPVWSVDQYRGIASKIDALFAISGLVTPTHLLDFLDLAKAVLSEPDPALELPEDKQWMAGIYGKVRKNSAALRRGICETLVILAVHGNNLFTQRLGIDAEAHVSRLIRELLRPLTLEKLMSHESDLPRYAEAAPDAFLALLENDLRQPEPVLLGLLQPVDSGVFGGRCRRSGLLWALEKLAWKPQHLGRVTPILAQLSRTPINDNWSNKPIASLGAIYFAAMPQTAAPVEIRIQALETLVKRFPDIAWQICTEQFSSHPGMRLFSQKPEWRNDATGAGQLVSGRERYQFARRALDIALAWLNHDGQTLGDLIESLQNMPEGDQERVWASVDAWATATSDEDAKAALRERIRRFAFTRRGRAGGIDETTRQRARQASAKLEPRDLVARHSWLFLKHWVEESAEEIDTDDLDHTKRGERIHQQRLAAMKQIWSDKGLDGAMVILQTTDAPSLIGHYLGLSVGDPATVAKIVLTLLTTPADAEGRADGFLQGFLHAVDTTYRITLMQALAANVDHATAARLFRCGPFGDATWRVLDSQALEVRRLYWEQVLPQWNQHTDAELNELVDRLLAVGRPRAAFQVVHMDPERIETARLKRLLQALPHGTEPAGTFRFHGYHLAEALKALNQRAGVTREEMAQLEFLYLRALEHGDYGIPNLEAQVGASPVMFVQAVAYSYKRRDDREDPPDFRIEDPEKRSAVALSAHELLERIARIPGSENGVVNADRLRAWLVEARRLCSEFGRADIGDQRLGMLLSKAPAEPDASLWPCRAVCEALEAVASEHIGVGFSVGTHNKRGAVWRASGGDQERELAAKYRAWAEKSAIEYPFVSSVLENIASSYDRQAEREDSEAKVTKRLRR
jgi:addiction module HigA family antidote